MESSVERIMSLHIQSIHLPTNPLGESIDHMVNRIGALVQVEL